MRALAATFRAETLPPCRRQPYTNAQATRALSRMRSYRGGIFDQAHLEAYQCRSCGLWHLGHSSTSAHLSWAVKSRPRQSRGIPGANLTPLAGNGGQ